MDNFKNVISGIVNFSPSELNKFTSVFSEKTLKKGDYFAVEGEYSSKFAFINEGVMRAFFRNHDGQEYNKTFFIKDNFVGAYSSLITGNQNSINIECLTDCTIITADYSSIIKLYDTHSKVERLSRILAEQYFVIKEKREIELVMLDAKGRYQIFQENHPNLEQLIPQYHIASYLGVSPTQLSRIRAQK